MKHQAGSYSYSEQGRDYKTDFARKKKQPAAVRIFREDTGWILGVCAGLARRVGCDPAILRVATIIALIFHPAITIGCYLLLWVIFFRSD
ncbi:MAG: PspC domain-containing protein [Gammaproteobacteria bacterium]|nr:PspC domain-containing protein [Gammaproteobacteria bacterium]